MSLISCLPLLENCKTIQDWDIVKTKKSEIFFNELRLNNSETNRVLYFALKNLAPFHTSVLKYQKKLLLIHGGTEILTLLDFVYAELPISRISWNLPYSFSGNKDDILFSDLTPEEQYAILSTKIYSSDYKITDIEECRGLCRHYRVDFATVQKKIAPETIQKLEIPL